MNKLLNMLLRSSISASMSDREAFTDKVAQILEDKIGKDPEAAQQVSERLTVAMENINEQLLFDQIFNPEPENKSLEEKLDKLTQSIEKLNSNIEKLIQNGIR